MKEKERNILSNSSTILLPQEYEQHGFESLEATGGIDKMIFHQHQLSGEVLYVCHKSINEHVTRCCECSTCVVFCTPLFAPSDYITSDDIMVSEL
jgi:hypothetical protein